MHARGSHPVPAARGDPPARRGRRDARRRRAHLQRQRKHYFPIAGLGYDPPSTSIHEYEMIRTVDIENFRCFEQMRIGGCRRINVIVGDNSSGKTILLEAMFVCLGVSPEIGLRYRQQRGIDPSFSGSPQAIQEAIWKDLFFRGQWQKEIRVVLSGDGPEARSVKIHRGQSQLTIPLDASASKQETRTAPIIFDWTDFEGKHHVSVPTLDARGFQVAGGDEDLPNFFYFAANQTIGSGENAGRFSEMRRAGRGQAFVKLLTKEYPWITDLDIEVLAGAPVIFAKMRNSEEMRPLAYVSGGINRMVGILLAMASRDQSVVLVDELEDGVFHTHHVSLWRALLSIARSYDGQIFATTHSYEWLKALMDAARDQVDDIALWRLELGDDKRPVLFQFDGSMLKDAIKHGAEARGR
jgi:hypothetical protein